MSKKNPNTRNLIHGPSLFYFFKKNLLDGNMCFQTNLHINED